MAYYFDRNSPKSSGCFVPSFDDTPIFRLSFKETGTIKGIVFYLHGLGEHATRNAPFLQELSAAGFRVHSYDQRGFGKTFQKSGSPGHFVSWKVFLGDLKFIVDSEESKAPKFLMGHSMGGLFSLAVAVQHQFPSDMNICDWAGVVSLSPALKLGTQPPNLIVLLGRIGKLIYSSFAIFINLETENLSRDPEIIKNYLEDTLCHHYISLGLGSFIIDEGKAVRKSGDKISMPLLLAHGTGDTICDIKGSQEFFDAVKGSRKKLLVKDGGFHELHFDTGYNVTRAEYVQWLEETAYEWTKSAANK